MRNNTIVTSVIATKIVDNLERMGLIRRVRSSLGRLRMSVKLTISGVELLDQIYE